MRFCSLLLLLPLLMLGACSKVNAPVRLDFIGTATLVSGNRLVNANDTLTTRAYAVGNDNPLQRLRITATYEPGLSPIIYPIPLSSYNPNDGPDELKVVYLDSLIKPLQSTSKGGRDLSEYLFATKFTARATSGTEQWQYTVSDATGESASRAYRLTVRNADSAQAYHSYTTRLRAVPTAAQVPDSARRAARVFLNLRYGLLLPKYAITNHLPNQQLVDLIGVTNGVTFRLSTAADETIIPGNSANWPAANRRPTELRRTGLTAANFAAAATTAAFQTAFNDGSEFTTNRFTTGTLAKEQVIAFRITEADNAVYYGLLLVSDLVLGTSPVATCTVRVQK